MNIPVEWIPPALTSTFLAGGYAWSIIQTRAALKRSFKRIEMLESIVTVNLSMGKLTMPTGVNLPGDE